MLTSHVIDCIREVLNFSAGASWNTCGLCCFELGWGFVLSILTLQSW